MKCKNCEIKNKEIEKSKLCTKSWVDAYIKNQDTIKELKHQLKEQKDEIFKEIEEMLDKLHRPTVNPNMIMQNNIITSLKEKIIEHLKHRKD